MRQDPGVGRFWVLWVRLMVVMTQRQRERDTDRERDGGDRERRGRQGQRDRGGGREAGTDKERQRGLGRRLLVHAKIQCKDHALRLPGVAEGCATGHTWASRPHQGE